MRTLRVMHAGWPCHGGGVSMSPAGRRTWAGSTPDSS